MKTWVMVLLVVIVPGTIHAQAPAQTPATASKGLKLGALPTVFVVDDAGVETTGKLLRLDHEAVVVLVNGSEQRFETRRVARVTKRGDSLKNGVIIGTVFGLVSGIIGSAMAECSNDQGGYSGCGAGAQLGLVALSTGVYAAIGTGIDAAIQGRTELYKAPPRRPDVPAKGGVSFAMRWTW